MKDEPWRGDTNAYVLHFVKKIMRQKRRLAQLEAENDNLRAEVARLREALTVLTERCERLGWDWDYPVLVQARAALEDKS